MDVVSSCPLPVASVLWQPRPGKWAFTFVCKATYRLTPTESELASEQEPPNEDDNYWNDDTTRSLYAPSDLVPFKARADVILVGHAFAPRREPTRSVVAQLMVGSMNKAIECFCDRMWTLDGQLREGPRFTKIPLRYERAAGGPETSNPVGMRHDAADAYGVSHLPNLQPPGKIDPQRGEAVEPIGFGPIAPTWPTRVEKLGPYASSWFNAAWNSQPVLDDIAPGYFNCAPADQQVSSIRNTERIILENLHPEHPRLVTNLPGTVPIAVLERTGVAPEELRLTCDTLWIDTDRSLCTLVWRGQVALDHPAQAGRVVVTMKGSTGTRPRLDTPPRIDPPRLAWKEGSQPPPPMRAAAPPRRPHVEEEVTYVADLEDGANAGALPFQKSMDDDSSSGWGATTAVHPGAPQGSGSALPFMSAPNASAKFTSAPNAAAKSALPFQARSPQGSMPQASMPQPPMQPPPMPLGDSTAIAPRPVDPSATQPPPVIAGQPPAMPPPLVRPPPTMDPIGPPPAATSPWARSGAGLNAGGGLGAAPPMPGLVQAPPVAPEPTGQGATFLPMFEPPVPTAPSPAATAAAATSGAVAASNAAAMGSRTPAVAVSSSAARSTGQASFGMSREVLMLLWYDPSCVKQLPENDRWAKILKEPDEDPKKASESEEPKSAPRADSDSDDNDDDEGLYDDEEDEAANLDEDEQEDKDEDVPPEVREKRDVFKVIARGEPTSAAGISQEVADAIGKDGTLEPPLVLVAGELVFPFDELETLKATVTAVSPLVAGDKKLKEVVDTVNELLKTPWLSRSGGVAEGLTGRIKEAFAQGNRMLPPSYLETHTERMLLEERHYQKRTVFGQTWIRSLFVPASAQEPIPAYLPEALTKQLPMFQRLKTRLLAEVHMQQDQYEAHPIALRVVALARVSSLAAASGSGGGKA